MEREKKEKERVMHDKFKSKHGTFFVEKKIQKSNRNDGQRQTPALAESEKHRSVEGASEREREKERERVREKEREKERVRERVREREREAK